MRDALLSETDQQTLHGLAGYLYRDGLIDYPTAKAALHAVTMQGMTLTQYLVQFNQLSSQLILEYCAKLSGLPVCDLKPEDYTFHGDIIKPELVQRYRVIPINRDKKQLYLGITDPTDHAAITAIGFHTGLSIHPLLVREDELDKIIHLYFRQMNLNSQLECALSRITPVENPPSAVEKNEEDDEPVIQFADHLIDEAIEHRISDIHIEPYEEHCRIRFRRDGLLHEAAVVPLHLATRLATRFKIMGNMNIAERRLPQDGRIQLREPDKRDIRINTCPTLHGEKMVLRILDAGHVQLDIHLLGLTATQEALLLANLAQPQGLILVTGPTGSGKTMTLYSALHYLNQIEKNIVTVEDPVEIELPGINQVNVNPKIGLDFASVLRTCLRQDPDIIMIGEIRDTETANIAVQAALTGHLVLSTLHTRSAVETMIRLQSMGIAAYHLANSISLIVAQRLVRKLCDHCKQPEILPPRLDDTHAHTTPFTAFRPIGCQYCNQGYQGRIGIFELLPVTEKITQCLLSGKSLSQILIQVQRTEGMRLWEAGLQKIRQGITSLAEITRVAGEIRAQDIDQQ